MSHLNERLRHYYLCACLLISPTLSLAHPVTFEDGVAFSSIFQPDAALVESAYSITPRFALGLTYLRQDASGDVVKGGFVNGNGLLYRYNGVGSQTNIYVILGAGGGGDDWQKPLGLAAFQADFETTRFYTAWMGRSVTDGDEFWWQTTYRIGVAPYEAEFNELQSWLVGQVAYIPHLASSPNLSMLLRFFYRTVLWELGGDVRGRPWIQLMVHY